MRIVFDIGATHTRIAASSDGLKLGEPTIFPTSPTYQEGLTRLVFAIEQAAGRQSISAIAGGVPGVLDPSHKRLINAPNIPNWVGQPLAEDLSERFKTPVSLANDVQMVGLGEATFGAGRAKQVVVYMTVSSGVNGVRIVNKQIDRYVYGFELGQQIIASQTSGQPIRLEEIVGGHALERQYGKPPRELAHDAAIWDNVIHALAVGVHNAILHWSPEIIVFGGGMMRDIPLDRLDQEVSSLLTVFPEVPKFRLAELDESGGLLGALSLTRPPR